ncbi:DUF2254 domain-containing protein [Tsuneonella amylolytica]|uniref:DUF2254 domain-containing protein n=1 Tax=Tsuneonella amylolytica TaxID=2338327 RepID=UPI002D78D06C|nr:DUF2254 domain-containing protein [Tsuneonella amylolytica]
MADIRWLWDRLNSNYWFYPALFSVFGAALAFVLIGVDRSGFANFLNSVPQIVPARPDSASNMLTVIAGSMIGTASTVFSITIAAVAYASGNYGPRLLTNFLEDRGNQLSLATFIGTFVYAVTVLRSVRAEDEVASSAETSASTYLPGFVPQLSLLVAYALMALSVAVLVYFLNHVPSSIRINTVLRGIGARLIEQLRDDFPHDNTGQEPIPHPEGRAVEARTTGYVQMVDFDELDDLARKYKCTIGMRIRPGDFVHPGMALADYRCEEDKDDTGEEICDRLHGGFIVGATRTAKQDPQFLIDELVEIALRALSPGINDPFTAITALHWLGAATAEIGGRDLRVRLGDVDAEQVVFPLPDDFAHFVRRGFGAVRGAVATSPSAALVMFDVLVNANRSIDDARRTRLLRLEGERLMEQSREALAGPELQEVEARFQTFRKRIPAE